MRQRVQPIDSKNLIDVDHEVIGMYKDTLIKGVVREIQYGWGLTHYFVNLSMPVTIFGTLRTSVVVDFFAADWKSSAFQGDDFLVLASHAKTPEVATYLSRFIQFQEQK